VKLTVERAAIRMGDGRVWSLLPPNRHHHVIRMLVVLQYPTPIRGDQGFVLSDGSFADRRRAREVAEAAGQLLPRDGGLAELYSEDVW
jgi:hypothetical protein